MWLIRRLFGGSTASRGSAQRYPGRPQPPGYGRRRSSGGFRMAGPFPTYSGRTRRGTRVSVSGCCLPIPLALTAGMLGGLRLLRRH